ncbi:MAG: hypothetical protein B6I20_10095 [Bacteroidetes bacterium 4572_117]|nr:MAG: hypothetical protein B6I20_10095 [Bacteroidetes bacterium 4572_117]
MKNRQYITLMFFLVAGSGLIAQDTTKAYNFDFNKLKPIVQVFGTASYNIFENKYEYGFGRAHLGFQYQFNKKWNAKIIIDRGRTTSVGEITVSDSLGNQLNVKNSSKEGSYYTFWLKFASLQWKVNDKLTLEGGAILQNHYITMERFWGLRYVAQTFQDLYWHTPSSDLGFIAYYKLNKTFAFDAAITNGEGPRVKQDAFGKIKMAGGLDINPTEKIQTRIFYHNRQSGIDSTATEQMLSFFIGVKPSAKFRVGAEFNYMDNVENKDLNSLGYSVYSAFKIHEKTEVFARFDRLLYEEPAIENLSVLGNGNTIMGGLSIVPVKGVKLSLNYQGWLHDDDVKPQNRIMLSMEYKI